MDLERKKKELFDYFNNGDLDRTLNLSKKLTIDYPNDQLGWKILGATLMNAKKFQEALNANLTSVSLKPDDSEAHNNLGNNLLELGKMKESLNCYKKAINLNPKYLAAIISYSNLATKLGLLIKANKYYKIALSLSPNNINLLNLVGVSYFLLKKYDESEKFYKKALKIKQNVPAVYNNLGLVYLRRGEINESIYHLRKSSELDPKSYDSIFFLALANHYNDDNKSSSTYLTQIIDKKFDSYKLRSEVILAIYNYLELNLNRCRQYLNSSQEIIKVNKKEFHSERIFHLFLNKLLNWHEKNPQNVSNSDLKTLYVVGESHSLSSNNLIINFSNNHYRCKSYLIIGCMQYHLGNAENNQYKYKFSKILRSLPLRSKILLSIGEIDCRIESGILNHKKKYPDKSLDEIIIFTINNFIEYINKINFDLSHTIIIQGVPSTNIEKKIYSNSDLHSLTYIIKKFNEILRLKAIQNDYSFLDIYQLTDNGNGSSNKLWHIDSHHIKPDALKKAWKEHLIFDKRHPIN